MILDTYPAKCGSCGNTLQPNGGFVGFLRVIACTEFWDSRRGHTCIVDQVGRHYGYIHCTLCQSGEMHERGNVELWKARQR